MLISTLKNNLFGSSSNLLLYADTVPCNFQTYCFMQIPLHAVPKLTAYADTAVLIRCSFETYCWSEANTAFGCGLKLCLSFSRLFCMISASKSTWLCPDRSNNLVSRVSNSLINQKNRSFLSQPWDDGDNKKSLSQRYQKTQVWEQKSFIKITKNSTVWEQKAIEVYINPNIQKGNLEPIPIQIYKKAK